jgi:hypothetical protein
MPPIAETSIEIDAPIALVWSIMTEARSYRDWNPFVVELTAPSGQLVVGGAIVLDVRWRHGGGARTVEVVSRLDAPAVIDGDGTRRAVMEYRYTGWLPRLWLVRGSREQSLEQRSGGATVYRTREAFKGLLAGAVPLAKVQDGFQRHAEALKRRAERLRTVTRDLAAYA